MSWQKSKNVYSRDTADPAAELSVLLTNMVGAIWGIGRPASSKEDGVVQRIMLDYMREVVRSLGASGWYQRGAYNFSGGFAANTFRMDASRVMVAGYPVFVAGSGLDSDTENAITLASPPGSGSRTDLVFLEVWLAEVPGSTASAPTSVNKPSNTTLYKYGNRQYGGTQVTDDINEADFEIRRRVQVQYRIRAVSGVDFTTYPMGVNDPVVVAQGGAANPTAIQFAADSRDPHVFLAGNGSATHQSTLQSIDGLVYGIPIAAVSRTTGVTDIEAAHVDDLRQDNGVAAFVRRIGDEMSGDLAVIRGNGTATMTTQTTHDNSSSQFRTIGRTSGGVDIDGRMRADNSGIVRLGAWSNHVVEWIQNNISRARLTASGVLEVLTQLSLIGSGGKTLTVETSDNDTTAQVITKGRAGATPVDGRVESHAAGIVRMGSWSSHEARLIVDGGDIARFVPDGRVLQWPHGYRSSEQAITNGSVITLSHGMPARPSYVTVELVCVANSQGHTAGGRLVLASTDRFADTTHHGIQVAWDATEIKVLIASHGPAILHGSTFVTTGITNSNWRIVVTAWP